MNTIKEKLESIKWLDKEIRALQLEQQYIVDHLFQKSSLTSEPKNRTTANHAEDKTIKAIEMRETVQGKIDKLVAERETIINLIENIEDPKARTVLRLFYVNQLDPMVIADTLETSTPTIYRYKKTALELLENNQR